MIFCPQINANGIILLAFICVYLRTKFSKELLAKFDPNVKIRPSLRLLARQRGNRFNGSKGLSLRRISKCSSDLPSVDRPISAMRSPLVT